MAEFYDGKDASALRSIGAVSAALGIKPHVLRYWEGQFPSLKPLKRAGGRRLYRPEDVALIERIDRLLSREGYTLRGAKAALESAAPVRERAAAGAAPLPSTPSPSAPGDVLTRLKAIRAELAAALAA